MKKQISIDYYPEGDMLSVTFGETGRNGHGIELNDYIYIRIDNKTQQPLGLTFISYSNLIKARSISLTFWNDLTTTNKQILLSILKSYPINKFLNMKQESINIIPASSIPDT